VSQRIAIGRPHRFAAGGNVLIEAVPVVYAVKAAKRLAHIGARVREDIRAAGVAAIVIGVVGGFHIVTSVTDPARGEAAGFEARVDQPVGRGAGSSGRDQQGCRHGQSAEAATGTTAVWGWGLGQGF